LLHITSDFPPDGRLLMQRTKIETGNLKIGMYVAQLDRSWLETPFLFQGFEIREKSELDLLQKTCIHVYIEIAKSSLPAEEIEKLINPMSSSPDLNFKQKSSRAKKPTIKYRVLRALSKLDPTGNMGRKLDGVGKYRIRSSFKKEVPKAADAYDTAISTIDSVLETVREGRAVDIEQVRESISPMIESVLRNPGAMTWFVLLKKRDKYTYNHSIALSVWAAVLGRHLGFDRPALDAISLGALLLDIGKARLPEDIFQSEDALLDAEMKLVQQHVEIGVEIAKETPGISNDILDMIASHHERYDGSGYPNGTAGAEIPVYGRIAGLIDCYDAMTSNRLHAKAMSSYEAIRELNSLADTHFQKELVEQFVQALGMFPAGSIVELNSGEIGIVVEQNRVRRLRPKIMIVLDPNKNPVKAHKTLDLRKVSGDRRENNSRWISLGHEPGAFDIDPAHYFIG
jgi:putative nucleotidyltransferase with HDIG domain